MPSRPLLWFRNWNEESLHALRLRFTPIVLWNLLTDGCRRRDAMLQLTFAHRRKERCVQSGRTIKFEQNRLPDC